MSETKEEKPKFKLPPRLYDILYITNKYKVSEYAVTVLCDDLELGKHYKQSDGRTKFTQVGLMCLGKVIKKRRENGEDLDLIQPDDERRVIEVIMRKECINNHLLICSLGDKPVTVSVKPFIKKNFAAGKPLLVERIDDQTYVAPPRMNG